ncbi:MAG TPA: hypothetical protein VGJ26_14190 [Pirellulales bacterium]
MTNLNDTGAIFRRTILRESAFSDRSDGPPEVGVGVNSSRRAPAEDRDPATIHHNRRPMIFVAIAALIFPGYTLVKALGLPMGRGLSAFGIAAGDDGDWLYAAGHPYPIWICARVFDNHYSGQRGNLAAPWP